MCLRVKMKSNCNITPSSGSTSTAMSLILIHEDPHPRPVDHLDALIDPGSGHATSAPSQGQLPLPDVMLDLSELLVLTLQLLLVDLITLHFGHSAFVIQVDDGAIDLWVEIMVILEELQLTGGVSAQGSG